ncbi:MAG: hypothetical protein IKD78_11945 [Bacteroidales bacterium]|nr:hypothetical protein [Bacteroidales bacterium]
MNTVIITELSIKDIERCSGNFITDDIVAFLDELFKTTDKVLLSETRKVYIKSEILDLANVIIDLKEKENEK